MFDEYLDEEQQNQNTWIKKYPNYNNITDTNIAFLSNLYKKGYIIVESLELMALHIIKHCKACQNHLKARFKYVFVDELDWCKDGYEDYYLNRTYKLMYMDNDRCAIFYRNYENLE